MKHTILFVLMAIGVLGILSGCRDNRRNQNIAVPSPGIEPRADLTVAGERGQIRTGLGVVTSVGSSRSATGGNEGLAQVDSTLVAITLDEHGIITRATFDVAQTRIGFNAQGQITTDLSAPVQTKGELADAYNMRRASGIDREYNEQMASMEVWAIGQTPARFMSMALDGGRPAEVDLRASVTVNVTSYLTAMERAMANLKSGNSPGRHRTGLGVATGIGDSRNATATQTGRAMVASYYAVLTLDEHDVIIAAWVDSTQSTVEFDTTGTLQPLPGSSPTRQEMGSAYGMRRASPIGREWNEQMQDFAQWMVGKTPTQVIGMSLNNGRPAGADLVASVTINMTPILAAVERAAANAR